MEVSFRHGLTYETESITPVQHIADSLIANERLLNEAIYILGSLVDGLEISEVRIAVKSVVHESPLKEIYWAGLILTFQEDLVQEIPLLLEQLFNVDISDQYNTLVIVTVLLLAFYGADYVYRRINPDVSSRKIKRMFDGLVADTANILGKSESEVREELERQYGEVRLKQLAKAAIRFFSPAKIKKGASIRPEVGPEVPADVIEDIPSQQDVEDFEPPEVSETFENVEIEIHQQDVDYSSSGWAGILRGLHDKRLRMRLYPPITPEDIYTKIVVTGDVILVSRRNDVGNYVPYMFHLVRIKEMA